MPKNNTLEALRGGGAMTAADMLSMIFRLSVPAMLAQLSSIIMQYIDASMVGRLGAEDSASIGLVASSTWLLEGLCMAAAAGFSVQIAHLVGAGDEKRARSIVRLGLLAATLFSVALAAAAAGVSGVLPRLLGGAPELREHASVYFLICVLALPVMQLNYTAAGMIQSGGNMKVPGFLEALMCFLDVVFNAFLIFPSRTVTVLGRDISVPGAGLGVAGAALGTALSALVVSALLLYYLLFVSKALRLRREERFQLSREGLRRAVRIGVPVAVEQTVTCGAYIAFTKIVAPLGTVAIAANSFSITAESLCYMPGYGIGSAAATVIGQSVGAGRADLTKRLGRVTVAFGSCVMAAAGVVMYIAAPGMIALLTPVSAIRTLGAKVLRIEAFAEPLYGASIVSAGVFRGAGDTVVPTVLNLVSMWAFRIPLAYYLGGRFGLEGVWTAMCAELCLRGLLFIVLMASRFNKRADRGLYTEKAL